MRRENTIFSKLFKEFKAYTENIAFDYNDINIQIDFKVLDSNSLNVDVPGNYLLEDSLQVVDENGNLVVQLAYKDKFLYKDTYYFIDEFNKIRNIDEKYNNTIAGQYGVNIKFGDVYNKTSVSAPEVYLMMRRENNLSPLETDLVTIEKTLEFGLGIVVDEGSIFDATTNYDNYEFILDFITETIYNYFNDCPNIQTIMKRITDWRYDNEIIEEERPLIRGLMSNTLIYI